MKKYSASNLESLQEVDIEKITKEIEEELQNKINAQLNEALKLSTKRDQLHIRLHCD